MITGKINITIKSTIIPSENSFGGTPMNNTANKSPSVTIRNPLVTTTNERYLEASSIYGPSITSDFALMIENGYSFKRIIYPTKNTTAPIAPARVNMTGP